MAMTPVYQETTNVGASAEEVLAAPGGNNRYTFVYIANEDDDIPLMLYRRVGTDNVEFALVPAGQSGGFPALVLTEGLWASGVGGTVDSVHITAW